MRASRRLAVTGGRLTALFAAGGLAASLSVVPSAGAQRRGEPVVQEQFVAPAAGEPVAAIAQPDALGAGPLAATLASIGTTARVLMIGAHPDDEDTQLIAWLARGRHVETAYLSLTRGDGGQNLIGNELGPLLGVIRTEELLAARERDGGRQFFSRAFDFGFSKSAEEAFTMWPRDSVLSDVVRVVRAFRPHVIVAVFTGTPRDGHGHHQASGQLALEAYEQSANETRFPAASHGVPWEVQKLYRAARRSVDGRTLRFNVGEFSPLFGRSFAEIASESRSQHKSQGFGSIERRGAALDYVTREQSRAPAPADPNAEQGLFDGIDTTWSAVVARSADARVRTQLDSAGRLFRRARTEYRVETPDAVVPLLAKGLAAVRSARDAIGARPPLLIAARPGWSARLLTAEGLPLDSASPMPEHADPALWDAITLTEQRASHALALAAGVAVEANTDRELLPARESGKRGADDTMRVSVEVYNRGAREVELHSVRLPSADDIRVDARLAPDSAARLSHLMWSQQITMPWWSSTGRDGAMFRAPIDSRDAAQRERDSRPFATARLSIDGTRVDVGVPVVHRFADPVRGDRRVPVAVVPGITVGLNGSVEYARADVPLQRVVRVNVLSAYPDSQRVTVQLDLPPGLLADSARRERVLEPNVALSVPFIVTGALPEGVHTIRAQAVHMDRVAEAGYYTVRYDHITPRRSYSSASTLLSAVPVALRDGVRVGYIAGVSDDGVAALRSLDVPTEVLDPASLGGADLSAFTTIVIGPRAYQVSEPLRAAMPRLFAWAEQGGTLVVQYGQYEMQEPGLMPYPITLGRPATRVTRETAPVTILDPRASLLTTPNRIAETDWDAWVQERSLYMPSTFDPRYRTFVEMHDPDEPESASALLAAPLGKGLYVYSTIALFRQLPYGVPGAARLLVNLVSARGADFPADTRVP